MRLNMLKLCKILFLTGSLLIICYSQETVPEQYEKFDPLTLNDPFLPIANGTMIHEIFTEIKPDHYTEADSLRYIEQMGWKVQVLSIKDGVKADSILQKLNDIFGPKNTQMIWTPPYWKIRVGNCTTRMEAERLLDRVKDLGYERAWIIQSRVRIQEKQLPF